MGRNTSLDPAELAECVVPLDEEGAREVRLYWDRVIGEVWAPAPGVVARAVSVSEVVDACTIPPPDRPRVTAARWAAVERMNAALRVCPTCGEDVGHRVPRSLGQCWPCSEPRGVGPGTGVAA